MAKHGANLRGTPTMNKTNMNKATRGCRARVFLGLLAILGVLLTDATPILADTMRHVRLGPAGHVTVSAASIGVAANIFVRAGAGADVVVHRIIKKGDGREQYLHDSIAVKGDSLTITVQPYFAGIVHPIGVTYDITVPTETSITYRGSNGWAKITGVRGPLDLSTANGNLAAYQSGSTVRGRTTNGNVEVELARDAAHAAHIELRAVNGNVSLQVPASFDARVETSGANNDVVNPFWHNRGPGLVSLFDVNGTTVVRAEP